MKVCDTQNPLDDSLDASNQSHFPLELGFALTCKKSEGQTISKVIIVLSQRDKINFTFEGLNVASSRVKATQDERFFVQMVMKEK